MHAPQGAGFYLHSNSIPFWRPPPVKWAYFFLLFPERVIVLFHWYFIFHYILGFLFPNVFSYCTFIHPHCTYSTILYVINCYVYSPFKIILSFFKLKLLLFYKERMIFQIYNSLSSTRIAGEFLFRKLCFFNWFKPLKQKILIKLWWGKFNIYFTENSWLPNSIPPIPLYPVSFTGVVKSVSLYAIAPESVPLFFIFDIWSFTNVLSGCNATWSLLTLFLSLSWTAFCGKSAF